MTEGKNRFKFGFIPVVRYFSSRGAHGDDHLVKMSRGKTGTGV